MLEAGWPLHHVQAVLGHADATTTSTYLNATIQHLDSMRRIGSGSQPLHQLADEEKSEHPLPEQQPTTGAAKSLVN